MFIYKLFLVFVSCSRVAKVMDALSVVSQLRDLATEPQNREAIVQDQGCLPGLVLFMGHEDTQVLFATLQVNTLGIIENITSVVFGKTTIT